MARKLKCRRKPRSKITGYLRCEPGTALKRNTTAERKKKSCARGGQKYGVSTHRRKVCHSK